MRIINATLTKNPCYTAGRKITVKGLMLHSVGCAQPSATVFTKRWNSASYDRACVHAFIDANSGDIYQTLPWNHRAWHSGGSANNTHIGVEMCESSYIKYIGVSDKFTVTNAAKAKQHAERAYKSAVELFAFLCKEYGLNPLTDIISHNEGAKKGIASGHSDPEHYWKGLGIGYTMDGFRNDVKKAMGGTTTTTTTTTKKEVCNVELPVLRKGSEGDTVKALQILLIGNGYSCGSAGADGDFGNGTLAAVKKYQTAKKLAVDGVVGVNTWKSLML